jgi:signal transduction histidine kinase
MLKKIHIRLTVLYVIAGILLVGMVGLGSYSLLQRYFQSTTDLALQHRMAHEVQRLGVPLTADLLAADSTWYQNRFLLIPDTTSLQPTTTTSENIENYHEEEGRYDDEAMEDAYDGELAAIFVFPLSYEGKVLFDPNPFPSPISPDLDALKLSLQKGQDWRTVTQSDGNEFRLFTYQLPAGSNIAALQLGRSLGDQRRILFQLIQIIGFIAVSSVVLIGISSWWLSARSIEPMQQAILQQKNFIANASHELRAPLTLIRAGVEYSTRFPSSAAAGQTLTHVLEEIDHMNLLVEDLLLLSRLDNQKVNLSCEDIHLNEMLGDVCQHFEHVANERGVSLHLSEAYPHACGDRMRLRQVIVILVDNALRHTPFGGEVLLGAVKKGHMVEISVSDTGSGISKSDLPHIFERFYQAGSSRSEKNQHAGLGLAIAKSFVEAQGGEIRVWSELGKGSRFSIFLPIDSHNTNTSKTRP